MQATRSKPRCKQDCEEHLFQLKNNNGNNKLDAHVNFCPKFRRDPHRPEKTIPEYNLDHKYFTHAFVLGTQMKTLRNNAQQQQMHFQTLVKDACEKNNQVIFPRPNEKNCYCSVCKEHFRNYFEHINTQNHRIKIDAAVYNTEIKRLTDTFKPKWEGAHTKANQILNQLVRQNEMYQKAMVNQEDEEEEQPEEEQAEQQIQNEGSAEAEEGNENPEEANQEQNNESADEEQQEQSDKQKDIQQKQTENKKPIQEPMDEMGAQKQQDSGNLLSQQKVTPDYTTRYSVNSEFFEKKSQLVVFLKKNKNGKYQIAKDVDKLLVPKNGGSSEQKQMPIVNKIPSTDRQLRSRQQRKKSTEVTKKGQREVFKIKNPEKQASSQYKGNSSSYEINQQQALLCQNLKDRVITDRIRTRNQRKEEKIDSSLFDLKLQKPQKKQSANKEKPKQPQEMPYKTSISHHPPYPYYNPAMHPYPNMEKGQMPGKQMMNNHKIPQMPPPYQMYLPPTTQPNQTMIKSPSGGRIGPPTAYMPHPSMMMNPSPYFGYGMPPRPQNPTSTAQKPPTNPTNNPVSNNNIAGDKKERPPPYPLYWNPYMMNHHPMMRPEGSGEQPQQTPLNMAPRQSMGYPPNPYHMMPPPPPPGTNSKPGTAPTGQTMPHNPNMYMQYPMDARYYLYPPNGFVGKKTEETPSSGPPPPARDPR